MHESNHRAINSASLDVPFKLGLNIGNFSFSQQSEPSQHIQHIQHIHVPTNSKTPKNSLHPQISTGSDNDNDNDNDMASMSDEDMTLNTSNSPYESDTNTNNNMIIDKMELPPTPLTLENSNQSSSTISRSQSNPNNTINHHNKKKKQHKKPTFVSLMIDTSLRCVPSGNSLNDLKDDNDNDTEIGERTELLNNNNELFHVIDCNAEPTNIGHHGSPSSFLMGNRSPSLGSMILDYSDNNNNDFNKEKLPPIQPKHASSCSASMIETASKNKTTATKTTTSLHRRKSTNNLNIHKKNMTSLDLQSFPTLTVPQNARKLSVNSRRSSSSSNILLNRDNNYHNNNNKLFSYLFSVEGKLLYTIHLPSTLPPSKILLNSDNLRDRMIELYDKYIGCDSIHELNLPFNLRNRMNIIFKSEKEKSSQTDNKTSDEYMYNIMDQVACSILRLMRDSFNRFKYIPKQQQNKKNNQKSNIEISVLPPVLRNANSYSDILNEYNLKTKDYSLKISL